jgi:preprotein translocase subunit SecE
LKQLRRIARFFKNLNAFLKEAWEELKRTHRPSRQELVAFTIVVLITMGVVAAYVGTLDVLFRWLGSFVYPS